MRVAAVPKSEVLAPAGLSVGGKRPSLFSEFLQSESMRSERDSVPRVSSFARMNRLLVRLGALIIPPIAVGVRPSPTLVGWFWLAPMDGLPKEVTEKLREGGVNPQDSRIWVSAIAVARSKSQRCRICGEEPVHGPLGLGIKCFESMSRLLQEEGLLTTPSQVTLESTLRTIGMTGRFWARYGAPKIWVASARSFGIVPGREGEFCEAVNRFLELPRQDWVSPSNFSFMRGLK